MCCCVLLPSAVSVSHRSPGSFLCGSHSTTAATLEGLPLVAPANGASVCMRIFVCGRAILNLTSWTIPAFTSEFQEHSRITAAVQQLQQKRYDNTGEARIGSYT